MVIGAIMIGIGINWFIGGLILKSTDKDIANDGILISLIFGGAGVLIWLMLSHPGNGRSTTAAYSEEMHRHCPNCTMAVPFYAVHYCPHCGKELDQTKPSYTISEVK